MAATSAAGANRFTAIQIPTVSIPDTGLKQYIDQPTADGFLDKVDACFKAIMAISTPHREEKQQKQQKLKELRQSIHKTIDVCPREFETHASLEEWVNKITAMRQKSKKVYQTHAHHFIGTEKGFHLMEGTPSLEDNPRVRIDLDDIQGTFTSIQQAPASDKIEGLRIFRDKILRAIASAEAQLPSDPSQAAKIDELNDALAQIADNVDSLEGVEETSALKQYRWRTKDAAQVAEFASFLDPDGIKEVSRLFLYRNDLTLPELSSGLLAILNERYYSNPCRSPIDYVKLWPTSYKDIDQMKDVEKPARIARIKELFGLVENTAMEDPLLLVIYDYLFNFYDPTGDLRREYVEENFEKIDKKCQTLGSIGSSMVRLGLNLKDFLKKSDEPNPLLPSVEEQKSIKTLLEEIKTKSLTKKEIILLSTIIKAEAASLILCFDIDVYCEDLSVFDGRYKPLDVFHRQFRAYFQQMVESVSDDKRKPLLRNLTLLAKNLADTGEFNLSQHLFLMVKEFHTPETKEKCAMEYGSLANLFHFERNMGCLRDQLKKRVQAGLVSIPLLTFVNGDCVYTREMLKLMKEARQERLEQALGPRVKDFNEKLTAKKKSKEAKDEWVQLLDAVRALDLPKDDPVKALLRTALKNETLLELKVEKQLIHLYAAWLALKIYNKSYKSAPETKAFIDAIALMTPFESKSSS